MTLSKVLTAVLFLSLAICAPGKPAEWPQWRGPNRDAVSTETGLLKEWTSAGPTLAWKATGVGRGFSSVSVADGRIFTLGDGTNSSGVRQYIQLTGESVAGVAPDSGRLLWRAPRRGRTAIISTPIFHDDHVYVTSGYGVGCNLFKLTKAGDSWPHPVVAGGKLYLRDQDLLLCYDLQRH